MAAPAPESAAPDRRRLFSLATRAALPLLATVLALDVWAMMGTDPDYYLPDLFRPVAVVLVVAFLALGFVRWPWTRQTLRLLLLMIVGAILVLEARSQFREVNVSGRVQWASDPVLRYNYKPGWETPARLPDGRAVLVNSLGFIDVEHAIPKPKDVFRVVVLTGSIANDGAVPFDERFFREVERALGGRIPDGKRVEVANVSCEGYSTVQQVRALELSGLKLEPDVVVLAYMLSSASVQNGAYRRIGNSFFLFRFLPLVKRAWTGSMCSMFEPFHEGHSFNLIVRNSLTRLSLLERVHGFRTLVAVLPVVERVEDPVCARLYDQVVAVARETGFEAVRVADQFKGVAVAEFAKPNEELDVCHPNASGHKRIGRAIADGIVALLEKRGSAAGGK